MITVEDATSILEIVPKGLAFRSRVFGKCTSATLTRDAPRGAARSARMAREGPKGSCLMIFGCLIPVSRSSSPGPMSSPGSRLSTKSSPALRPDRFRIAFNRLGRPRVLGALCERWFASQPNQRARLCHRPGGDAVFRLSAEPRSLLSRSMPWRSPPVAASGRPRR